MTTLKVCRESETRVTGSMRESGQQSSLFRAHVTIKSGIQFLPFHANQEQERLRADSILFARSEEWRQGMH